MAGSHNGQQLRFCPFDLHLTLGFVLLMLATDASRFTVQKKEGTEEKGFGILDIEILAANNIKNSFALCICNQNFILTSCVFHHCNWVCVEDMLFVKAFWS